MSRSNPSDAAIPAGLTPDQMSVFLALQERMVALTEQQAKATSLQEERTRPRENPNYKAKSIFLQEDGEPWAAKLKCEILFGPIRLNRTPLTQEEVEALNQLQPVEKAVITKTDGSLARVTVRATENAVGTVERLAMELDLKKDNSPQHFPSLCVLARELAAQAPVAA